MTNKTPWQDRLDAGRKALADDPSAFLAGYVQAQDEIVRLRNQLAVQMSERYQGEALATITKTNAERLWADRDGLISRAAKFQSERDAANLRASIAETQLRNINEAIETMLADNYKSAFPGVGLVLAMLKAKITRLPPATEPAGEVARDYHPQLKTVLRG